MLYEVPPELPVSPISVFLDEVRASGSTEWMSMDTPVAPGAQTHLVVGARYGARPYEFEARGSKFSPSRGKAPDGRIWLYVRLAPTPIP